ncbi:MAG TPA: type II toxin-antitoxin system VapC family toxin [Methylomirabilota bacterium]|nr:type II toxin-antitoxin system VapC family toxin [Methylomirabilota bacterium]
MILLDTHALVWLVAEPARLSRAATDAIRRARSTGGLAVASITLWELAILLVRGHVRGHGTVDTSIRQVVDAARVSVREITPVIAALSTQFPDDFPRDPADRLIAATARADGLTLVTRDERIRASALVKTVW